MQLFHSPYVILLDHKRKALVVAIRGTLSLEVCTYLLAVLILNLFTYVYLCNILLYAYNVRVL